MKVAAAIAILLQVYFCKRHFWIKVLIVCQIHHPILIRQICHHQVLLAPAAAAAVYLHVRKSAERKSWPQESGRTQEAKKAKKRS